MIRINQKGNFNKITKYLAKCKEPIDASILKKYGNKGVVALTKVTPIDTGKTAGSWYYTITNKKGVITLSFNNSNIQNGIQVAVILQYGHATKNGYYVQGIDYINPALAPIFDEMAREVWKEVTRT